VFGIHERASSQYGDDCDAVDPLVGYPSQQLYHHWSALDFNISVGINNYKKREDKKEIREKQQRQRQQQRQHLFSYWYHH